LQAAHILVGRSDLGRIFGMGGFPGQAIEARRAAGASTGVLPAQIETSSPETTLLGFWIMTPGASPRSCDPKPVCDRFHPRGDAIVRDDQINRRAQGK
jgi:hypothetical protein